MYKGRHPAPSKVGSTTGREPFGHCDLPLSQVEQQYADEMGLSDPRSDVFGAVQQEPYRSTQAKGTVPAIERITKGGK